MIAIQVRILAGPDTGKRLLLRQTEVSFGRDPGCDLLLDLPFVSRRHGALRFEDGRWVLVNESANGTRLGAKLVTKKPRPIKGPTPVIVGDTEVFEIVSAEAVPDEPDADDDTPQPTTPTGDTKTLSGRSKLWIGIGGFWVIAILLMVFIDPGNNGGNGNRLDDIPPLTAAQIEAEIRRLPEKQPPAPKNRVRLYLQEAHDHYNSRNSDPGEAVEALQKYKLAWSYTLEPRLQDIEHRRRFQNVQDELVARITKQYKLAHDYMSKGAFTDALREWKQLQEMYPDPRSRIFKNAQAQSNLTKQRLAGR